MQFAVTYLMDRFAPSETFIQRELEQLRRRNWPVDIELLTGDDNPLRFALCSCPKGCRVRFVLAAFARIFQEIWRNPLVALRIIKRLPQCAYLIKKTAENNTPLIHSQFAGITADLAAIAAATLGINWSCSVHAKDVYCTPPAVTARRLRGAAAIAACSRHVAEATRAAGIPEESIHLIYHGIPLDEFPLNTVNSEEFIFTACRLNPKKGIDTLIKACGVLRDNGIEMPCVIAGSGSELMKLKKLCEQLNLTERVLFKGWLSQEETQSYIRNAILIALPSRRTKRGDRDGIANILVEALALGTPVITTTAGAADEVIRSGENGILVGADDHLALAHAMTKTIESKALRSLMIKEGRRTAESLFGGAANIHKLEKMFNSVVVNPLKP